MKEIIKILKASKGIDRKRHFESGGTVESWRGKKVVNKNKKKYSRKAKHKGEY